MNMIKNDTFNYSNWYSIKTFLAFVPDSISFVMYELFPLVNSAYI